MTDEDRPVTRKDLGAALGELRDWFAERLEAQEARFEERLEAQETRLLTAFHRYAEASHDRMRKVEVEQHIDGDRLTKIEERVRMLEERLDFPHQSRPQ